MKNELDLHFDLIALGVKHAICQTTPIRIVYISIGKRNLEYTTNNGGLTVARRNLLFNFFLL